MSDDEFYPARREAYAASNHVFGRHQVALVREVGLVALFSVNVIAVVEPSSFFTVIVVPEIANSPACCKTPNNA